MKKEFSPLWHHCANFKRKKVERKSDARRSEGENKNRKEKVSQRAWQTGEGFRERTGGWTYNGLQDRVYRRATGVGRKKLKIRTMRLAAKGILTKVSLVMVGGIPKLSGISTNENLGGKKNQMVTDKRFAGPYPRRVVERPKNRLEKMSPKKNAELAKGKYGTENRLASKKITKGQKGGGGGKKRNKKWRLGALPRICAKMTEG